MTDSEVIGGMLLQYIEMPENLDKIEWLLRRSKYQYNNLGLLADENVFYRNPAFRLDKEELNETVSKVKWEVKKFLDSFGIAEPDVKYYDDNRLAHPSNKALVRNTIASLGFGMTGMAGAVASALAYTDGDMFHCAGMAGLSFASLASFMYRFAKALHHYEHIDSISGMHYWPDNKTVYLNHIRKEHLVPSLAHELTHHIQYEKDFHKDIEFVMEGHARGVQRAISGKYAEKTGDSSYLVGIVNMDFSEYKAVYSYLCNKKGISQNKALLEPASIFDVGEYIAVQKTGLPSRHALGNALFSILELGQGEKIYSQILREKIRVTRLPA